MSDPARWQRVGLGAVLILSALFAYSNSGERVALQLGPFVLYQVSLVLLIFVAFLAGMLTMFVLGLRHDMKVRRALQERGFDVPPAPARETPPAPPFPPYPPPDPEP